MLEIVNSLSTSIMMCRVLNATAKHFFDPIYGADFSSSRLALPLVHHGNSVNTTTPCLVTPPLD